MARAPASPEAIDEYLREIGAEPAFRKWCVDLGSLAIAWQRCERPDWMLHLLEHSGQPDGRALREFAREVWLRHQHRLATADRGAIDKAVADGFEAFATDGLPGDAAMTSGARATIEAAAALAQSIGNWTPARVALIALAALHDDPMTAAQGASEQAGMAAQYIHEFPTATDWPDEMARQADLLRQIVGNPFQQN